MAVGANGTPEVLHAKLHVAGVACDATIEPGRLSGIAIGHSAHVSPGGYVPAAPYAAPGAVTEVRVLALDDEQLAAVDATEPNYNRVRLDARAYGLDADGTFDLYVSRCGVLALDGQPVAARPQVELHALLAAALGPSPFDPRDPVATAARLARPDVQASTRQQLAPAGLVAPSGLPGSGP